MSALDNTVEGIIAKYPESQWMARCREALPGAEDDEIMAAIEFLHGGDVVEVGPDGEETRPGK